MNRLILIALVCAAPIVLGTAAYLFGWSPGRPGNYGELLAPQPVSLDSVAALRGKWVLVTADAAACDAYCEKKLYFIRQVRRAQGKDMDRVARLWLVSDSGKISLELLAAIEGTHIARAQDPRFASDHVYLVDPLGNLMLRFPRDPDPSRMIKDLQRLLKYSGVG
ncbi:MAG TPA: cytochrome C oxidase subunit I [Burkholderiales bacterium]|nr:cytochrome C oxidase subunit I [Burkholderiales bacterium]